MKNLQKIIYDGVGGLWQYQMSREWTYNLGGAKHNIPSQFCPMLEVTGPLIWLTNEAMNEI